MNLVLATDIFGVTPWIEVLTARWQSAGHKVLLCSPYQANPKFSNETEAYHAFMKSGGFEHYAQGVESQLKQERVIDLYIGFSAGGAALWKALSNLEPSCIASNDKDDAVIEPHFIGFYPGQIRHYLSLTPNIITTLVMPQQELHFDLSKVIEYLVTNQAVNLVQNNLQHGYANPYSIHYQPVASRALQDLLTHVDKRLSSSGFLAELQHIDGGHRILSRRP